MRIFENNSQSHESDNNESDEEGVRMRKISRREVLVGLTGLSLGALAALNGMTLYERLHSQEARPLAPGYGDAQNQLAIEWLPNTVKRWRPQIEKYGKEYQVDPNLLAIIMTIESGGDPNAESGVAKGLMQITDPTAGDIAKRYLHQPLTAYDLKKPETSIEFGAAYAHYLIDQLGDANQGPSWDETVTLIAAGYNGGLKAAHAYEAKKWQGLEEYDHQTFGYARYVRVMWQERHDPLSFTYRYWYDTAHGDALVKGAENYKP